MRAACHERCWLAVAHLDLGADAEARDLLRIALAEATRIDLRFVIGAAKYSLGTALARLGAIDEARAAAAEGKMRADLFFRIATPAVTLPPLRARKEEIPWLVERAVREVPLAEPHVSLVEACLLRRWPGNVRELLAEVRQAADLAVDEGGAVLARHLGEHAGAALAPEASTAPALPEPAARPSDEAIAEALRAEGGNVSRASRALGMHRTQLYRWLERRDRPLDDG